MSLIFVVIIVVVCNRANSQHKLLYTSSKLPNYEYEYADLDEQYGLEPDTVKAYNIDGGRGHLVSFTLHYLFIIITSIHFTSLHLSSLHFTSLHFTSLHFTSLHFTSLHFTSLHFTSLNFTSLHCTLLHFTLLHFTQHYLTSI